MKLFHLKILIVYKLLMMLLLAFDVDINKLYDKTIPKVKVTKKEDKTKKRVSIEGRG